MAGKRKPSAGSNGTQKGRIAAEWIPIDQIKPWEGNPRDNKQAIEKVAQSIKRFGFGAPIVARRSNSEIIAGHTRVEAARQLGLTAVPVRFLDLNEAEARLLALADNKLGEIATWEDDRLRETLRGYSEQDIALAGWSTASAAKLLGAEPVTEDSVPDVPVTPVSSAGTLWCLGDHRLLCGDSTNSENVARLMGKNQAGLMNADPPYGIAYTDEARVAAERAHGRPQRKQKWENGIENDELVDGEKLQRFLETAIRSALDFLKPATAFYLWHVVTTQDVFASAASSAELLISRQIVWVKPSLVFGFGDYHIKHELCFYGWRRGHRPEFYGARNQDTVWAIGQDVSNSKKQHPTQKPVELFARPIRNHTKEGEIVYEPFSGSGSQFIAAEQLGRRCYGLELSPAYCDVIVERWENLTGGKATRQKG